MHEQSLVRSLLRQVDEVARQHGNRRVLRVEVEAGPLAGVEPLLLASAFEQLRSTKSQFAQEAELDVREPDLIARCGVCGGDVVVNHFDFRCPQCSAGMKIVQGDSLTLLTVTLEEAVARPLNESAGAST